MKNVITSSCLHLVRFGVVLFLLVLIFSFHGCGFFSAHVEGLPADAAEIATRIVAAAREDTRPWNRLAEFCDTFGPRPSGSKALEEALRWSIERMKEDGADAVRLEEVTIPVWHRGEESLTLLAPFGPRRMEVLGLGRSIGTGSAGIEADAVVVDSFDHLQALGEEVSGKIVVYDVAMPDQENMFEAYGQAVQYRVHGASRAARFGAVAVLVRSVTTRSLSTPHTGAMRYDEEQSKIPAAAITTEDASLLRRLAERGVSIRLKLQMDARNAEEAPSANAIGEILGREKPEEIVVVGAHIDSWDVGTGAHDDGAGVILAMESLRILKQLDLRPRRTVRVVLFTNEESGLAGGKTYADTHGEVVRTHFAAMESDSGAFTPRGFSFTGSEESLVRARTFLPLFARAGLPGLNIRIGGSGADISPLVNQGVPGFGLWVDASTYFDYHHTSADTVDKVDPALLNDSLAAFALLTWTLAEIDVPRL